MYLKLGTITKQVGLKGEVRVYSTTSFASKRYKKGNKVYVEISPENYKELTINSYRKLNGDFDVISFVEYESIDATDELLKKNIFALKENLKLNKGEFFFVDLIDCILLDSKTNQPIGKVTSVEEFPAQLTLKCIDGNNKVFTIPFIKQFIDDVDIENKTIVVEVIEGLLS